MRKPLTPNRRKAVVLAASGAALSGMMPLLHQHHPADLSDIAFNALMGLSLGMIYGASILLMLRDRRACAKT